MASSRSTGSNPRRSTRAHLAAAAVVLGLLGATPLPAPAALATCADWIAAVVSVQGDVQARRVGEAQWVRLRLDDTYCVGDMVRVDARSRAAIRLRNGSVLRLDQNTTITFYAPPAPERSWIGLLRGVVHFVSRVARGLDVLTRFVNAAVEGTEFWIEVGADQALLAVIEGRVAASNPAGSLTLMAGQSAVARAGQAPSLATVPVRPPDAVQWALYYPPVLDLRPEDFPDRPGESWPAPVRSSLEAYAAGDLAEAFARLAGVPADVTDPRFFVYRAGLLLAVGRVDEATPDIDRALTLDPNDSRALALGAIIAVARSDKPAALRLARRAVELDPRSAAAALALSYAQQASFDLPAALASAQQAVQAQPDSSLARARLAELWLASGELDLALEAASAAVGLTPDQPRAQTVLGFAYLSRIETAKAAEAFRKAIERDPADPLPRLGLGLARIRTGDLAGGREELEIAVGLDPGNALVRSYLGKAYYEEKRDALAAEQFRLAEELDPRDPTPWFYDAIRKQSVNRPVEALRDLQRAIELNGNRAVYRSTLEVDADLAARQASLGRIYDDLGFQQRALVEGSRSLDVDPSNYSAHRFLADAYAALPRHEIARVSELLQSQLLQPLNLTPVEPQLALSKSFILSGAGPADLSLNEFNPLFERNRLSVLASGVVGTKGTYGDELVVSGLWNRFSFSVGQFHYETDGFRSNNDLTQNIYDVFAQALLSYQTSVQLEFRVQNTKNGDLMLRFDPGNFNPDLRQSEDLKSIRLGLRHAFAPESIVLASFIYHRDEFDTRVGEGVRISTDVDGYTGELQHRFRSRVVNLVSGLGYFDADRTDHFTFPFLSSRTTTTLRHANLYLYPSINPSRNLTVTLGASADFFDGGTRDREQLNPKIGVTWTPFPTTIVRAAAFRTLKRTLVTNQTLEPTQIAGFNQFFDDAEATDSWRYGIGVDQKFAHDLYAGVEGSRRESTIPFIEAGPGGTINRQTEWKENLLRAYLYWTPADWLALSGEYQYEQFDRDNPLGEGIAEARTHRLPLAVAFFHPSGFQARLVATWVNQSGRFADAMGELKRGDDQFVLLDASLGYRLPKRWGLITLEGKNLLDEHPRFQDTDPANPQIAPERTVLLRFTLSY